MQGERASSGQFGLGRLTLDSQPFVDAFARAVGADENQKLQLLAASLRGGLTAPARQLLAWARDVGVQDVAMFPDVCNVLAGLVGRELDRLLPGDLLPATLLELLELVGMHLNCNVRVLCRLLRALHALLAADHSSAAAQQQVHERNINV